MYSYVFDLCTKKLKNRELGSIISIAHPPKLIKQATFVIGMSTGRVLVGYAHTHNLPKNIVPTHA